MHGSSHSSPVLIKKARLEIIPLIDIMFFLLASFMLVSLTMINMKAIDVALPTATSAQPNTKPDFIIVSIDALMDIYFEKEKVPREEVLTKFQDLYSKNHEVRIYLRADKGANYDTVMFVLDSLRTAGIQKVGLEVKPNAAAGGGAPTSGGGAPPPPSKPPGP
ncbi:MAG TPA: biopolymer transporter ExbD [Chthoniobacterales bacterium]|jgi:biopolymer transport protein ExbD|nr:biopolymer transporter ExbD [Chthoniobacterales bacterium]